LQPSATSPAIAGTSRKQTREAMLLQAAMSPAISPTNFHHPRHRHRYLSHPNARGRVTCHVTAGYLAHHPPLAETRRHPAPAHSTYGNPNDAPAHLPPPVANTRDATSPMRHPRAPTFRAATSRATPVGGGAGQCG
jgi:hypothetical protein